MRLDGFSDRIVDRILFRRKARDLEVPGVRPHRVRGGDGMSPAVSVIRSPKARELQGKRAGFASRVTADLIDYGVVVGIYLAILLGIALAEYFLGSGEFDVPDPDGGSRRWPRSG